MSNVLRSPLFCYRSDVSHKRTPCSSNNIYRAIWLSAARLPWWSQNPEETKPWFPTLLTVSLMSVGIFANNTPVLYMYYTETSEQIPKD